MLRLFLGRRPTVRRRRKQVVGAILTAALAVLSCCQAPAFEGVAWPEIRQPAGFGRFVTPKFHDTIEDSKVELTSLEQRLELQLTQAEVNAGGQQPTERIPQSAEPLPNGGTQPPSIPPELPGQPDAGAATVPPGPFSESPDTSGASPMDSPFAGDDTFGGEDTFGDADMDTSFNDAEFASYSSLENAPWFCGDLFAPSGQVSINTSVSSFMVGGMSEVPLPAATGPIKIAEQNKALPQDRVYFAYNHFTNALLASGYQTLSNEGDNESVVLDGRRSFDVDRYTFAFEKTVFDDAFSIEFRMPLAGRFTFASEGQQIAGGKGGNLAIVTKHLIFRSRQSSAVMGLGVGLPSGSDVHGGRGERTRFSIYNDAVHLLPYVGFLSVPNQRTFFQAFGQLDIAANGNPVEFTFATPERVGIYNEQTLLHLDFQTGYWLVRRSPNRDRGALLTGLAPMLELHVTRTLEGTDRVQATRSFSSFTDDSIVVTNYENRQTMVNLTFGLHTELNYGTSLRVAGVVPLRRGGDQPFDSEVQASLIQRF